MWHLGRWWIIRWWDNWLVKDIALKRILLYLERNAWKDSSDALLKRGVQLSKNICHFYNIAEESMEHVLLRCFFTNSMLKWILECCNILIKQLTSIREIFDFVASWWNWRKKNANCYPLYFMVLSGVYGRREMVTSMTRCFNPLHGCRQHGLSGVLLA